MQLRPYQVASLKAVRECWDDVPDKAALLVMATGTGKTATGLQCCVDECLAGGGRAVWVAHRQELVLQPYKSFVMGWPELRSMAGIVQEKRNDVAARMVFASVQTLDVDKRLDKLLEHGAPNLVVVDECHHAPSAQHSRVIDRLVAGGARQLWLSATPDRDDGKPLSDKAEIAYSYGIVDAIRDGWLISPYAVVTPVPELQMSTRRDYDESEKLDEKLLQALVDRTVEELGKLQTASRLPFRDHQRQFAMKGRKIMVFCITIEQAEKTAEALNKAGWVARHVSSKTKKDDRARLLAQFNAGKIDILCNCSILTEGTDLPICDAIVNARKLGSWPLFSQVIGRGLRLFDPAWDYVNGLVNALSPHYRGKQDCVVIDLSGATEIHDIISAPILVGATPCPSDESPNGVHVFYKNEAGKGVCEHCGTKRACWPSIENGGSGRHEWGDDGKCKHCQIPQCEFAPKLIHVWLNQPEHKRLCMWCGAESENPMATMLRREAEQEATKEDEKEENTNFLSLPGLVPETWAVDLGTYGTVLIVGDRLTDKWIPYWAPTRGRKPRPMCEPVDGRLARALGNAAIRQTERVMDKRRGREMYGGLKSDMETEQAKLAARDLAVRLGVAEPRPGSLSLRSVVGRPVSVPIASIVDYRDSGRGSVLVLSTAAGDTTTLSVEQSVSELRKLLRSVS